MLCRNLTGIDPGAVSGFIAVSVCFSHKVLIAHHLLAFPDEHLRCHIPVGDGVGFARIIVMVLLKAHIVQLLHITFLHRRHHQHLVDVFELVRSFFPFTIAVRIVYRRIQVLSLVKSVFLVNDPVFEAVEQIVFLAACRIHFDRLMRLGRAAVSFETRFFTIHAGIVPHDKDLHELAGFEAIGIAIAATGVCFMQRVGGSCRCGIDHAEVWHRRQQHRKRKQHSEQLLFESSSCFHVSSCFLLHIFLSQRKKRKRFPYASFVKRVVGTGDARPFLAAKAFPGSHMPYFIFHISYFICHISYFIFHISLSKAMKKAASFDTALCFIVFYQSMKPL